MPTFRASGRCPACAASIGRVRVDYANRHVKWYRWAAPTFRCPKCQAAVKPVTRPAGYILQALVGAVAFGAMLFVVISPEFDFKLEALALVGWLALIPLLAMACSRFGFDYRMSSTAAASGSLDSDRKLERPGEAP